MEDVNFAIAQELERQKDENAADAAFLEKAKAAREKRRANAAKTNAAYTPEKRKAAARKTWEKRKKTSQ